MGVGEPGLYAADDYPHYFDSVRDQLPTRVVALCEQYTLHDSRLVRLNVELPQTQVTMELQGYTCDDKDCAYILTFSGVSQMRMLGDPAHWPQGCLGGAAGLGDLGYYELEVVAPGRFEMRILFSTGVEMQIRWQSFDFECRLSETTSAG